VQGIVFDWDGTLVDTLGGLYRANVAVMRAFGLPFDRNLYRRHYSPDWRLMYERLGIPPEQLAEANRLWHEAFASDGSARAFTGSRAALVRLRDAGYRLGLVTAGNRDVVVPQIGHFGMDGLLTACVYGDDLSVHKPDPAPLRRALAELGLADRPDVAAYVGDAPDDMRMARSVGATGIGIASILGDPHELREAGAIHVAPSVAAWVDELLAGDPGWAA
jgi:HAD superfamily hydrolase (TIGR01549 family)